MARKMKGMTIHGGVAPKGTTKGGGPNGESGLSNSVPQPSGTTTRQDVSPPRKLSLRELGDERKKTQRKHAGRSPRVKF